MSAAALTQSTARSCSTSSSSSSAHRTRRSIGGAIARPSAARPAAAPAAASDRRRRPNRSLLAHASTEQQHQEPDALYELVARNQSAIRAAPIWAGALGFASLLANRTLSGVAPVVDAGSGQSRADVLGILMSAVLLLSGLQWLALRGREPEAVDLGASTPRVEWVDRSARLPPAAERELRWAWRALSSTARCSSLVLFLRGRCVAQFGAAAPAAASGVAAGDGADGGATAAAAAAPPGAAPARPGPVVQEAVSKGQGQYLANLVLYPGRGEFVAYLPEATQGVAVQPFGGAAAAGGGGSKGAAAAAAAAAPSSAQGPSLAGCLVAGSDTVRGLSRLDQAWLATLADKLEVSLEGWRPGGDGFGGGRG